MPKSYQKREFFLTTNHSYLAYLIWLVVDFMPGPRLVAQPTSWEANFAELRFHQIYELWLSCHICSQVNPHLGRYLFHSDAPEFVLTCGYHKFAQACEIRFMPLMKKDDRPGAPILL